MNVLFITTWDTACGIATYSANLIASLEKQGITVDVFSDVKNVSALIKLARNADCDIIHIQHEFGISTDDSVFLSIVSKFRASGIPVVVTCHSEADYFNILLDGVSDAVILHNDEKVVHERNTFSNFYKVPHGIPEISFDYDKAHYRKKYDIPEDAFVVGTCGFLTETRAQDIEHVMSEFAERSEDLDNIYFNIATSSHRQDLDGSYANSIRSGIYSLASSKGFKDNVFVGTEFMPVQEFRERLWCCDVGFHIAPLQAQSNSGAAADIISCGVPLFVNDSPHFSHLKKYSEVISEDPPFKAMVSSILSAKENGCPDMYRKCVAASEEIGYSKVASKHISIYDKVMSEFRCGCKRTPVRRKRSLNKDMPLVVRLPNNIWQVLMVYGRVGSLDVEKKFILQDTGNFDASVLEFVLDRVSIDFGDVGMSESKNSFHLQSKNISQDMSGDVWDWVSKGNAVSDFFSFCGEFKRYDFNLGSYAINKAESITDKFDVILGEGFEGFGDLLYDNVEKGVAIVLSPSTDQSYVKDVVGTIPDGINYEVFTEDVRTRWSVLSSCSMAYIGFGDDAVFSLISGNKEVNIYCKDSICTEIVDFLMK